MAQPITYTPTPARTDTTAEEELRRLLQSCHEHGVLRFANDLVGSNTEIAKVVMQGLESPGVLNALQNLSILFMALSRIPPEQFYRLLFAAKDAMAVLASEAPSQDGAKAGQRPDSARPPGVRGAYRMLHDEELWQALQPFISAVRAFGGGLHRQVENPISEFSGKSGRPS